MNRTGTDFERYGPYAWQMAEEQRQRIAAMFMAARCTRCGHVYDLGKVTVTARYTDCSVWKCPGCGITVDDRPVGWGDHHYVDLDEDGREKRR